MDYKEEHLSLVQKSGLVDKAIEWLSENSNEQPTSTLGDYCELARDDVVKKYIKHDKSSSRQYLDLPRLLHDRHLRKTSYGNQSVRMLIGPIYAPSSSNRDTILQWAQRQNVNKRIHQGIWLGASHELFGASLSFQSFIKEINSELQKGERNSRLNILFQAAQKGDGSSYQATLQKANSFINRTDHNLMFFNKGKTDSHLEIMVFPGEHGCALIQYHAQVMPGMGLDRLTIPIGYFTTDPENVRYLWDILRSRIQSPVKKHNSNTEETSINQQLKCNSDELENLLMEHSQIKLQALVDKFNAK